MNLDAVIARAAPPPERADAGVFEPAGTAAGSLARRRELLEGAFGSREAMAAHAEALGLDPEAWLDRFRDVRLAGPDPDWARMFRAMFERLSDDGPRPFAAFRHWIAAEARARWPAELPHAPDVLERPLDHLAGVLGNALLPTHRIERGTGSRPTWEARFQRSPALAYVLGRATADWLADLTRIAGCAAADRAVLARAFFGGEDPGTLLRIEPGLGDPHAGGRSVAILRFERGGVVYKPKDLRIAAAVGEIAGRIDGAALAAPALLARDGYAWEPVYEAHPLAGRDEADAFFAALGGWLALLQALNANDFWFDNLIADGAAPRFIDFETVVQPPGGWLHGSPFSEEMAATTAALPVATGILPLQMATRDGQDPTDLGCLTRPGEHSTPLPDFDGGGLVTWREDRFAPRYGDGAPADAADHFDAFEDGYLRAARALAAPAARERLVETLRQAADAPIRIVRLDTWTCYRIIRQSLLPRYLSNGVWREIALHAALRLRPDVAGALREGAVRDLRRLDVPLFQTRLDSRDLFGVEGERLRDFFARDALSATRERLRMLAGLAEDERSAALRSAFSLRIGNPPRRPPPGAKRPPPGAKQPPPGAEQPPPGAEQPPPGAERPPLPGAEHPPGAKRPPPARADDMLAWADEIASGIVRRAVRGERGGPTWIGPYHDVFTGRRVLGRLGFDVLSGQAGLAGALLELARGLDRPDLAALACEGLTGVARDFIEYVSALAPNGAGHVVGAGGLVATLARAPALRPLAFEVWQATAAHEVWMHSGGDFVSGLAGWREAAAALGEPAPSRHGPGRPYAPSALARLAIWLDPENAAPPLCPDRRAAARLRRDLERHGSWFPARWLDDRHDLSGVDGLPALAVRFVRLAQEEAASGAEPGPEEEGSPAGGRGA